MNVGGWGLSTVGGMAADPNQTHVPVRATLPLVESFGDFVDIPSSRIVAAQADGRCPYVIKAQLGRWPEISDMATLGFVEKCATTTLKGQRSSRSVLFTKDSDGTLVHIFGEDGEGSDGALRLTVGGVDETNVNALVAGLRERFCEVAVEVDPNLVPVRFSWYSSAARFKRRLIESPQWGEVSDNYPSATKAALDTLHAYAPGVADGGRLLMFHGEPGTGKTTAVRSLARSWAPWCSTTYIVDPESLFTVPDYLLEVALEGEGGSGGGRLLRDILDDAEAEEGTELAKWQLIVVEDVDELIRADAKSRTGQALGRLLNLTDGLLGQGLRTMFLLTTNERMEAIHPAISRPGRCLANIEFSAFSRSDGEAWLRAKGVQGGVKDGKITLAELFSLTNNGVISARAEHSGHGVYL